MDTKKLKEVLAIQTYSNKEERMIFYLQSQLNKLKVQYTSDNAGNIYVTKGDANIYPCIVAHMDTVHFLTSDLTVLEIRGKLTGFNTLLMEQTGIGGDDKVGVFIALTCLNKFDNLKVVFFVNEEQGCVGSYDAEMKFFDNCSFVLQCDRMGNEDFINDAGGVPLSSKEFQKDIKPILSQHGYKFHVGMMTDVMALKENGLEVSAANMSCGYYHPHSYREYVDVYDVFNCLNMVEEIIEKFGTTKYPHTYTRPTTKKWGLWGDTTYDNKTYSSDKNFQEQAKKWNEQNYPTTDKTAKICNDCWENPAVANGMCKQCNAYYKQESTRMGYDYDGYDEGGYDISGFNEAGYDMDGYDWDGYDKDGYDKDGYDLEGYDIYGYDKDGWNIDGCDTKGVYKEKEVY